MFVKFGHQSHAVFADDPGRFVAVFVIFESVVDRNSCHPDVDAGLQWISVRVESQDGAMLCDSILQQNHINVVMERLVLLKRWFLSFQFAGQLKMRLRSEALLFAQESYARRP